jgi:hypothetical protein
MGAGEQVTGRIAALIEQLDRKGWTVTQCTDTKITLYRWATDEMLVRDELVLIMDRRGRLTSWSTWRNTRTHIDGDTGLFDRLEVLMGVPT